MRDNKLLDYWQFIRHFGYSRASGAFKNARIAPPKRGDCDMMLTSKNLSRDNMIIRGSVQTKVDNWNGLSLGGKSGFERFEKKSKIQLQSAYIRVAMQNYDPQRTGFIAKSHFEHIMLEFCPELNEDELEYLCKKYVNQPDGLLVFS